MQYLVSYSMLYGWLPVFVGAPLLLFHGTLHGSFLFIQGFMLFRITLGIIVLTVRLLI